MEQYLLYTKYRSVLANQGITELLFRNELYVRSRQVPVRQYTAFINLADAVKTTPKATHHMSFYGYLGLDLIFLADRGK